MDRISALRNVEAALTEFERGETDLDGLERQVQAVLRTYATDFEDDRTAVYVVDAADGADVAAGDADASDAADGSDASDASDAADAADATDPSDTADTTDTADATGTTTAADATVGEVVVVAGSPADARDRASEIAGVDCDRASVERLSE